MIFEAPFPRRASSKIFSTIHLVSSSIMSLFFYIRVLVVAYRGICTGMFACAEFGIHGGLYFYKISCH